MNEPIILAEGSTWLALDKPAGLVVHDVPGEKHAGSTLVDWLRTHVPTLDRGFEPADPRPGIVHRLDADTSGIILVAKTSKARAALQAQFKARTTEKQYQALVFGDPGDRGEFRGAIGRMGTDTRHAVRRLSFSWEKDQPKPALTTWQRAGLLRDEQGREYALVDLWPKTGRTHQLRVQLEDHGTPIIGDQMYNTKESRQASATLGLDRQFLHAITLSFADPETDERITIQSPLAEDLADLLNNLVA